MKTAVKEQGRRAVAPVARVLANVGISPNHITVAGLLAMVAAGVFLAFGRFRLAGLAVLVGGLCDMLDGAVARDSGQSSRFGAFLDSTADRYAELFFFAGLLVWFIDGERSTLYALLTFLATGGSFMVSYTRARSEGLGIECKVGLMERPERMVLLIAAAFAGPWAMKIALWVLTPLVFWTSFQRIQHVQGQARLP